MSFTTVAFFVFLLAGIVVYYVLPKNVQWIWLLILSYIYYFTLYISDTFSLNKTSNFISCPIIISF